MIFVPNKKLACTPLGNYRNVKMTGNGFKTAEQKSALIPLTVVFGDMDYHVDDRVWIRGDAMTLAWTKEEFTIKDAAGVSKTFILVPTEYIQLRASYFPQDTTNE